MLFEDEEKVVEEELENSENEEKEATSDGEIDEIEEGIKEEPCSLQLEIDKVHAKSAIGSKVICCFISYSLYMINIKKFVYINKIVKL